MKQIIHARWHFNSAVRFSDKKKFCELYGEQIESFKNAIELNNDNQEKTTASYKLNDQALVQAQKIVNYHETKGKHLQTMFAKQNNNNNNGGEVYNNLIK